MPKETWSAINSPVRRLITNTENPYGLGMGKLIWDGPEPPLPPYNPNKAWEKRIVPMDIGFYTAEHNETLVLYIKLLKDRRENTDEAKAMYKSRHGVKIGFAKKMQIPTLQVLEERLADRNMTAYESHLLGVTCLHGKGRGKPKKENAEQRLERRKNEQVLNWFGLSFIKKAHLMHRRDPEHLAGFIAETNFLLEEQKTANIENKRIVHIDNTAIFSHSEGKEQFTIPHYHREVEFWTKKYIEHVMGYQKARFVGEVLKGRVHDDPEVFEMWKREAEDLQRRCEGEHNYHVRIIGDKKRGGSKIKCSVAKYILEQNPEASAYFLYRNLAIKLLRRPWGGGSINEWRKAEELGFKIGREMYERASNDPSNLKNYKGFFAYVMMRENINTWKELRDEVTNEKLESGPSVDKRAARIMQAALLEWRHQANPTPVIDKPLFEIAESDDILDKIPR